MPDKCFPKKEPTDPHRAGRIQVPKGSKIGPKSPSNIKIHSYGDRKLKFGVHVDEMKESYVLEPKRHGTPPGGVPRGVKNHSLALKSIFFKISSKNLVSK